MINNLTISRFQLALNTAAAVVLSIIAPTDAAVVIVDPSNMGDWVQVADPGWTSNFTTGPASPPLGTGSAHFANTANGDNAGQIRSKGYNGVALSSLTALSYSTYA